MATLATTALVSAGNAVPFVAASAGGDAAQTGDTLVLLVKNGDASSHTVTLVTPGTVDGLAVADRAVVVAAGTTVAIPLKDVYTNPATNLASFSYDAVTSVTVAVVKV